MSRTPAGKTAPPQVRAIFRRCPPGCVHASGLLLTPPRTLRRVSTLRGSGSGSMIASSPPNRCYAHLLSHHGYCDGLVTSSITAATVAFPTAGTRMPCPPNGLRLPAHRAHSRGFRLSEVLCHGVAPVLRRTRSCPSFILLYHARLPLSSADLAVADSPSFARRRTAARRRAMQHVAPVARCRQAAAAIRRRQTMPAASSKSVSSTPSTPLEDGLLRRPDFEASTGHVTDQALIRRMI